MATAIDGNAELCRITAQRFSLGLLEERERRKRAELSESHIRQALVAKDAVIAEVHHRVKNTIQIAGSLLLLQARASSSTEVRVALLECRERLNVLAKVHELLYKSAGSAQKLLMPSLLHLVGDALQHSFAELSARVQLHVGSDPIELSPDAAIPLILLANEAITNAFKHAFPGDARGNITVTLQSLPDRAVCLRITDNGVGMLPNVEAGLGLKLIRSFSTQLHGAVSYAKAAGAAGTAVTLTIPA